MIFDGPLSTALFGCFLWAVGFMIPRAVRRKDPLAITGSLLTAALALIGWGLLAVRLSGA